MNPIRYATWIADGFETGVVQGLFRATTGVIAVVAFGLLLIQLPDILADIATSQYDIAIEFGWPPLLLAAVTIAKKSDGPAWPVPVVGTICLVAGIAATHEFWLVLLKFEHVIAGIEIKQNLSWPAAEKVAMSYQPFQQKLGVALAFAVMIVDICAGLLAIWEGTGDAFQSLKGGIGGRKFSKNTVHGGSRFADKRRLRQMSQSTGVVVGQMSKSPRSSLLKHDLQAHAISIAPPRSGKGNLLNCTLIAPPNSWDGPILCVDPKLENLFISGPARSQKRKVIVLDPTDIVGRCSADRQDVATIKDSVTVGRFNPLDLVGRGEEMFDDIDQLMVALWADKASEAGSHFSNLARALVRGRIAWVLGTEPAENHTLACVYDGLIPVPAAAARSSATDVTDMTPDMALFAAGGADESTKEEETTAAATTRQELKKWMERPDISHGIPATAAALFLQVDDKEFGSILTTVANELLWVTSPQMRRHLSTSDFDINDLLDDKIDVFLGAPATRTSSLAAWYRIWSSIPAWLVEKRRPAKRILAIIDEWPALGRIDIIPTGFRVLPGLGLTYWCQTQDIAAVKKSYGQDDTQSMLAAAELVLVFEVPAADVTGAEMISKMCGETTYEYASQSETEGETLQAGKWFGGSKSRGGNKSTHTVAGRLMTPSDLTSMENGEMIAFCRFRDGKKLPVKCFRAEYFRRPETKKLAGVNPYFRGK
jgi:type IV secretion system protein VirD4